MAAPHGWFPLGLWLLRGSGSIRICGCFSALVLSLVVASPTKWFSFVSWMLLLVGSLAIYGCSSRLVPFKGPGCSSSMVHLPTLAAQRFCFSSGSLAASHQWFPRGTWLLCKSGSLPYSGCSVVMAHLTILAAHHNWFGQPGWLLAIDGSLPDLGCSVFVFLSPTLAALQIWFSHVEGLLYIYGSVVYIGSGTRTRFQVWPNWLFWLPSAG